MLPWLATALLLERVGRTPLGTHESNLDVLSFSPGSVPRKLDADFPLEIWFSGNGPYGLGKLGRF